ncbi:MAG: hypothetical protein M3081_21270, partial [Gemmatimonadota bacterium]|nr:hypothetical protein [Gemmatimonadota bacterium]
TMKKPPVAEVTSLRPSATKAAWTLRYSSRILTEDLPGVGHAALARAKAACEKKLAIAPEQYGDPLHHPLHGLRKLKTSHVRIVYHVEPIAHEVWILMIGDRRDIWDEEQDEVLARMTTERTKATTAKKTERRR